MGLARPLPPSTLKPQAPRPPTTPPPPPTPTPFAPHARFRTIGVGSAARQRDRIRRNLGPAAAPPHDLSDPYSYDALSGPLAPIFATIGDVIDLGVPDGTLDKDDLSWRRWERFCRTAGTTPWRMNREAHSGADPLGYERECRLLCAFLIWCYDDIQPRSKSSPAPKPESAYAMVCGVRRIHRRHNVTMVSCSQLSAVLKGITQSFIREHGAEALLPHRRQPLGPNLLRRLLAVPSGSTLGSRKLDWSSPLFLCLGCMFALGGATGFRKAEVALPANTSFDDKRLSRSSLLWYIDGVLHADPPVALLLSLAPGRDYAVVKPPRSKADQDGTKFGALPIYLPFDPNDPGNAALWLQRLETRFPCHGTRRSTLPLFFEEAVSHRPMSHATVDLLLKHLLRCVLPEVESDKYSFHSFRSGFACALLAAGCPPGTIQALARWSSEESLKVYARLNPSDYAAWITKASTQRTDSTTTRHMPPLIDEYVIMESFLAAEDIFKRADARFAAS
jgi:hypothetical protein